MKLQIIFMALYLVVIKTMTLATTEVVINSLREGMEFLIISQENVLIIFCESN